MFRIHIVTHTHWDREWYMSFQLYRIRLTRLIKSLLTILERDEEYVSYYLDGQSIVIKDYLEVHPEDREILSKHIASGRIKLGPWYVQPDQFLVSGESIIRNYEMGIRTAEEMGGSQRVGYLPDMFGHISQMPQIVDGFGMKQIVLWRGLGDTALQTNSELIWAGPDGTEKFTYRYPNRSGYAQLFRLSADPEQAAQQIREFAEANLLPTATTQTLLLMSGVDHMEPQTNLTEVIKGARAYLPEYELIHSTLEAFLDEVQSSVNEQGISLKGYCGEIRDTNRDPAGMYNFLLANVLSSRVYLKQKNTEAQYQLERWAEPLSSVLFGMNGSYPAGLLNTSWEYLLQNHPHDSICGCSRDEVHRQMVTRFEWSSEISQQMTDEALQSIMAQVDTSGLPDDRIILHVYNPSEWEREDTVTAEINLPLGEPRIRTFNIYNANGELVPSQVVDLTQGLRLVNHPDIDTANLSLPTDSINPTKGTITIGFDNSRKVTVRFAPGKLPALGYSTFTAIPVFKKAPEQGVLIKGHTLENEYLRAEIQPNGSLTLLDKQTDQWYEDLLIYEDGADIGDGYTYSPPLLDELFSTRGLQASISIIEDGPAHGKIRIVHEWALPSSISSDRKRRSDNKEVCKLTTEISLGLTERWLGVTTHLDNRLKDHRLRVMFPTDLVSTRSWSNTAFDIVERDVEVRQPAENSWIEDAVGAYPNHGIVGITDESGDQGFAVAPFGLPEYELASDGTLRLTLLRAVGHMGSPDPLTIVGGAGPNFPTPEGQCLGDQTFRFAIIPHKGSREKGKVWRKATEHHLPVRSVQLRKHTGTLPLTQSFLTIEKKNHSLVVSAVKKAWKRDSIVIRLFNPTEQVIETSFTWWQTVKEAFLVDIQEERIQPIRLDKQEIEVIAAPKKIITIELVL